MYQQNHLRLWKNGTHTHWSKSSLIPLKKYIPGKKIYFLYECKQNQGEKNLLNFRLAFKGQFTISKILSPLILYLFIE